MSISSASSSLFARKLSSLKAISATETTLSIGDLHTLMIDLQPFLDCTGVVK